MRFNVDLDALELSYRRQLKSYKILGVGAFGEVFQVTYRCVKLASKSIIVRGGAHEN